MGIEDVEVGFEGMPGWGDPVAAESRAIGATCGGVRVWSLYVPNGRKIDDPHYVYKLDWLARLRETAHGWLGDDVALVGDWNIAPQDEDVFDMAAYVNDTHVTPPERAAFQAFLDDGWVDVVRPHTPGPDVFTYWDYYRQRFERNRGMRIDFVVGTPSLASRVTHAFIDRDERAGTGRLRPRPGARRPRLTWRAARRGAAPTSGAGSRPYRGGVSGARTLWEEGHEPGRQMVALGLALSLTVVVLDVGIGGRVGLFFDLAFVAVCLTRGAAGPAGGLLHRRRAAAADHAGGLRAGRGLPPGRDRARRRRPGPGGVTGLSHHAVALGVGYAACLLCLAVRDQFSRADSGSAERLRRRSGSGRRRRTAAPRARRPTSR